MPPIIEQTKVGIVGAGPWARTLASSFEVAGAKVCAYARRSTEHVPDFGERMEIEEIVTSKDIDVIVAATPPKTTLEVMKLCIEARKPCFLTKPLLISTLPPQANTWKLAPTYVDYVHLWAPLFEHTKKAIRDYDVDHVSVEFCGDGPVRDFPGVLDYGPHALAMVFDVLPQKPIQNLTAVDVTDSEKGELVEARFKIGKTQVNVLVGNGSKRRSRKLVARLKNGPVVCYAEEPNRNAVYMVNDEVVKRGTGHNPLALMIERFLWDVESGRSNPYLLELSALSTRTLEEMRDAAGLPSWRP